MSFYRLNQTVGELNSHYIRECIVFIKTSLERVLERFRQ
ncbi:Uncharacterised protein [Escherichia coli]|nr:hypothetical protein EC174900_0319 [Escherichia coli 174900]KDG67879.1 hypothetical protein AF43_00264 [Escherichia coli MGH 57]SQR63275.1 Uncharacterised protein [Escherichia coli]SQR80777.1 Uncharacterised protein [Escherichia coli]